MQTYNRFRTFSLALLAALSVASLPANAQFGGLVNKAKEKAAAKSADQMAPVAPGEQLNEDVLGKVLAGVRAADVVLGERDRLDAQRTAKNKELSALEEKNRSLRTGYNEANEKIISCRSASFSELDKQRNGQMEARMKQIMADPAMMGKMQLASMKYAKAMADAQQKNDAAGLQKAQMQMMQEATGMDMFAQMKKDTVATDSKCGKTPAMPAAMMQEEKLRTDIDGIDTQLRTLEAQAVNKGAAASGLEQVRYLALKERVGGILKKLDGQGSAKFADDEMSSVRKHQDEIKKLQRAL